MRLVSAPRFWTGIVQRLIDLLKVPAVHVERDCAEVFREKRTRVAIDEESEFGPFGKYL
jgi:hypothetical protein